MQVKQFISIGWRLCEKYNCCVDYEHFEFFGSPGQAITFALETAKLRPDPFNIQIFQVQED